MNNQKPESRVKGEGATLDFHSMFFTIQGEGPFAGHRSIFIRLAGCNLQCPGCDTEYTQGRKTRSVDSIVDEVFAIEMRNIKNGNNGAKPLIVITGGEPLRQPIGDLVNRLLDFQFHVQIESNGVFAPDKKLHELLVSCSKYWLQLIVSPKTNKVNPECKHFASAFKYVLDHREVADDGLPIRALQHKAAGGVARPPKGIPVYINPFDAGNVEDNKKNLDAVARSCMKHGYIAGVQMHKLMNLE